MVALREGAGWRVSFEEGLWVNRLLWTVRGPAQECGDGPKGWETCSPHQKQCSCKPWPRATSVSELMALQCLLKIKILYWIFIQLEIVSLLNYLLHSDLNPSWNLVNVGSLRHLTSVHVSHPVSITLFRSCHNSSWHFYPVWNPLLGQMRISGFWFASDQFWLPRETL